MCTPMKERFTALMEKFIALAATRLPDDALARLRAMREREDSPVQKALYDSYFDNYRPQWRPPARGRLCTYGLVLLVLYPMAKVPVPPEESRALTLR